MAGQAQLPEDPQAITAKEFGEHAQMLGVAEEPGRQAFESYRAATRGVVDASARMLTFGASHLPMNFGAVDERLTDEVAARLRRVERQCSDLLRATEAESLRQLGAIANAGEDAVAYCLAARLRHRLLSKNSHHPRFSDLPGTRLDLVVMVADALDDPPLAVVEVLGVYALQMDALLREWDNAIMRAYFESGERARAARARAPAGATHGPAIDDYLKCVTAPIQSAVKIQNLQDRTAQQLSGLLEEDASEMFRRMWEDALYSGIFGAGEDEFLLIRADLQGEDDLGDEASQRYQEMEVQYRQERARWLKTYIDFRIRSLRDDDLREHALAQLEQPAGQSTLTQNVANSARMREEWLARAGELAARLRQSLREQDQGAIQ